MNRHTLTAKQVAAYTEFLRAEERTAAIVEKYSRDIRAFAEWLEESPVTKETVARRKERLEILLETVCAAGIRVSEVRYITVEAAKNGRTDISLKGKIRTILLPAKLADILEHSSINTTRIYLCATRPLSGTAEAKGLWSCDPRPSFAMQKIPYFFSYCLQLQRRVCYNISGYLRVQIDS